MGKLRRDQEEDVILAKRHCQHQGNVQKSTLVPLAKLLSHVQVRSRKKQLIMLVFTVCVCNV